MPKRRPPQTVREEPADKVALEARARHWGITVEQAKNQKAATWYGVLCIQYECSNGREGISPSQYEGLSRYRDLKNKYLAVKGIPGRDTDGGAGSGEELPPEFVKAICEAHDDMMHEIREAQNRSRRNLYAALDFCVMRGQRHEHMFPDLVQAADVLRVFFGVDGAKRAA